MQDRGIGIPSEQLASIFELFAQGAAKLPASEAGLGIGLSLVRDLVALHDGTIQVLSEGTGTGSQFIVRLPLLIGEQDSRHPQRVRSRKGALQDEVLQDGAGGAGDCPFGQTDDMLFRRLLWALVSAAPALVSTEELMRTLLDRPLETASVLQPGERIERIVDAADSAAHLREYLTRAGNRDVTIEMYPNAGHQLVVSKSGYNGDATPPERFVPQYPQIMITWLARRGFTKERGP